MSVIQRKGLGAYNEANVTTVTFEGFRGALNPSVPYYREIFDSIQIERNITVVTIFKYIMEFLPTVVFQSK